MNIPKLPDLEALAKTLGIPKYVLTRCIFQSDWYYKNFKIKKKSGNGYRLISAPSKQMKGIQRWISGFILRKIEFSEFCTAFRKGLSIKNNAEPHVNKGFIFCCDIDEFFPSITVNRIIGVFKSFGYSPGIAFALGKLTTFKGRLPQGAPSSPDLANIVCRKLDIRISKLSQKMNWSFTRYCDDITISGKGNFKTSHIDFIKNIINEEGFKLNKGKTRIMRRNKSQRVTGLTVNEKINIPRHQRKIMRAIFHQAKLSPKRFRYRINELKGYIAYLNMINSSDSSIKKYKDIVRSIA